LPALNPPQRMFPTRFGVHPQNLCGHAKLPGVTLKRLRRQNPLVSVEVAKLRLQRRLKSDTNANFLFCHGEEPFRASMASALRLKDIIEATRELSWRG
jgi:hypothetical protein